MAKYLITGASGQIRSYVLERFLDRAEAIGVDLRPSRIKELNDFIIIRGIRLRGPRSHQGCRRSH